MDNQPPPKAAAAGPSFPAPGAVKFPVKPGGIKPLVLPRRISPLQRAQEASQATAEARKSIGVIMSQSRPPWGGKPGLSGAQVENLEKALRSLETKLVEREVALADAENKLAERDRELAETEALLQARDFITPDDVKRHAVAALRHRVALSPDAQLEGRSVEELLLATLDSVAAPRL